MTAVPAKRKLLHKTFRCLSRESLFFPRLLHKLIELAKKKIAGISSTVELKSVLQMGLILGAHL